MRYLRYLALLGILFIPAAYSHAALSVGIGIGAPAYGPPACSYGYYNYYPYACAPYGYYGPAWFNSGIFIGAGPWFRAGYGYRGYAPYRPGFGYGYRGSYAYRGGGFRGAPVAHSNFSGGNRGEGGFHGGGGFHSGGGGHGGGGHR